MKTTATNRKVRTLLTGIKNKTLIPRPDFQRRLVWTTKDKCRFLDTVLRGYPFPEIYIAAGTVDSETGEGIEIVVDGQQRVTTLYEYFSGSAELTLGREINPYTQLLEQQKIEFLEYEVVVRDLGKMEIEEIKAIFERINSTKYSLNDMEVNNARFAGAFKIFIEEVSTNNFFDKRRTFSTNDIRRMQDMNFSAIYVITIMSNYFNSNDEVESYLMNYNDSFELKDDINQEVQSVFNFIDSLNLDLNSRAWKKSDLLTLLVETHRAIVKNKMILDPKIVGTNLTKFYNKVDNVENIDTQDPNLPDLKEYARSALQGTNSRSNRIKRGEILQRVLSS